VLPQFPQRVAKKLRILPLLPEFLGVNTRHSPCGSTPKKEYFSNFIIFLFSHKLFSFKKQVTKFLEFFIQTSNFSPFKNQVKTLLFIFHFCRLSL